MREQNDGIDCCYAENEGVMPIAERQTQKRASVFERSRQQEDVHCQLVTERRTGTTGELTQKNEFGYQLLTYDLTSIAEG